MAMHMQDNLSFEIVKDGPVHSVPIASTGSHQHHPASPLTTKAECIFNPKSSDPQKCWRSGDWLVDKLIPQSMSSNFDVVTIVGPLAHGKSHSLNTRIFRDVLGTSSASPKRGEQLLFDEQHDADGPGTIGVWAAYQNYEKFLVFDTQGYHEKTPLIEVAERDPTTVSAVRNAVKLMALSDVVIFHTATPRIDPNETFRFLQEAALIMEDRLRQATSHRSRPALIVFHQVLQEHPLESHRLRTLLGERVYEAFGDVQYLPVVRTTEKDYGALTAAITQEQTVQGRSNRQSFRKAFDALFSSDTEWMPLAIEDKRAIVPLELFACAYKCMACGKSCALLQHTDATPHQDSSGEQRRCSKFAESLKNRTFFCRKCNVEATVAGYSPDDYSVVKLFKYYTQGATAINCEKCKTIYRSDTGVWPPDEKCPAVETKLSHKWDVPGRSSNASSPIAPTVFYSRALLDPLVDASDSLVSIFKPKAQTVHKFLLDNVRPSYWIADDEVTQCMLCSEPLPEPGDKHHCRQCGKIYCESCSSRTQPVPELGWGETPVRVCNRCFGNKLNITDKAVQEANVNGRWLFEQFGKVVSAAESVGGYIGGTIVNQTMPDYWQKETDPGAQECSCCKQSFDKSQTANGTMQDSSVMSASAIANVSDKRRHHCRQCGKFVCGSCSPCRAAVPERGWGERPVRVCNTCFTSKTSSSQVPASSH